MNLLTEIVLRIINNLDAVFQNLLENIYDQTGILVSVISAGKHSEHPDASTIFKRYAMRFQIWLSRLTAYFSYHIGKDFRGLNFSEWHSTWEESVKSQFLSFYKVVTENNESKFYIREWFIALININVEAVPVQPSSSTGRPNTRTGPVPRPSAKTGVSVPETEDSDDGKFD